jgi:hypothetical protein
MYSTAPASAAPGLSVAGKILSAIASSVRASATVKVTDSEARAFRRDLLFDFMDETILSFGRQYRVLCTCRK